MGELSNTTINGVSYDFKDAGAARQSHSHTKSQITDFPTSMPASDVSAWAKASTKPAYTASEVGAVPNTAAGVSAAINQLTTGDSAPTDNDYYVSQYAGGGTSTTTYYRRPVSKLWDYIKSKLASKGSATQPVYFSNGLPVATTYTLGKSVPSDAKFTDTTYSSKSAASGGTDVSLCTTGVKYTWTNKGTYSKPSGGIPKTDLASAVQTSLGLADTSLQHTTLTGSPNLDTYLTTGVYHIATSTASHAPTTNHATLFVDGAVGTPYQIFKPDNVDSPWYTRHRSGSAWTSWVAMKFTDTTYSDATTSAAGLMSAADKTKLNGIATGAQVNSITGVKGNAESSYRTGNVNLTPANIGAAAASDVSVSYISPSDFFTPYNNATNQLTTPLCKQGKHIFGFIGIRATTATPIIGTIKEPYLPAKDDFVGIEYVLNNTTHIFEPTLYSVAIDGQMLGYGVFSSGLYVYAQVDYIIK